MEGERRGVGVFFRFFFLEFLKDKQFSNIIGCTLINSLTFFFQVFVNTPHIVRKNFHFSQNVIHSIFKLLRVIEIKLSKLKLSSLYFKKIYERMLVSEKKFHFLQVFVNTPPIVWKNFHFSQNVIHSIFKLLS